MSKGKQILYPHTIVDGIRTAVPLAEFPRSAQYLEKHRKVLEGRTYVLESGRNWYEIWVPQDPAAWEAPKLVFRDIAEQPTFWLDFDGSVVNGDCYWLSSSDKADEDLLLLALAVGNSTFAEEFYDQCFCNKLYSGRRRFCTQYVEHFPLPDPDNAISKEMIRITQALYNEIGSSNAKLLEQELSLLTWQSFGVSTNADLFRPEGAGFRSGL